LHTFKRLLSYYITQKETLIAQKRAEIAAKLAAMRSGSNTAFATPASRTPAPAQTPSPGPSGAASVHFAEDVGRRIAEAKRKVSEAQNKLATKDNPYMVFQLPLPFKIMIS
jgi:U4/U6 small nuclear ribonucleoprotein PRP3